MSRPLGLAGFGYKHQHRPCQDPYARGNEFPHRNRDTLFGGFANHQRHAHSRMFGGHSSPFGRMGGLQSPFAGPGGMYPMMGRHQQPGFIPPPGMGMGMGIGIGPGLDIGVGPPGRHPVIGRSPMGYQRPTPFSSGTLRRSHSTFPHRQCGYSSWPRPRHSPLSASRFLDEDDSDEDDDYDMSLMYGFPRRRRREFRHYRRMPYGSRFGNSFFDDYDDDYDGYEDFDEEDDEDDFDDFFPPHRWPRY